MRTEADPTIAARIPKAHYDALAKLAEQMTQDGEKKVKRSDLIRVAVAQFLRMPIED